MKTKLIEHILSIILIFILFAFIHIGFIKQDEQTSQDSVPSRNQVLFIDFLDKQNPIHIALLQETIHSFYPEKADSVLNTIDLFAVRKTGSDTRSSTQSQMFSWVKGKYLLILYVKFILIYILVMGSTYYGVQTLGVFRFILQNQNRPALLIRAFNLVNNMDSKSRILTIIKTNFQALFLVGQAILKSIAYLVLFSPAYVIAYSLKTKFDTDSTLFMILLGIISNGLLITYTNKFYTFLKAESRKGYVETAVVKNLVNDYSFKKIGLSLIFARKKKFPNHVFNHIYINARHQYLSTLKEQAAFLISGLIIIEMALNIHNHLSYELLQNLLYENYLIVLIVLFAIYLTVKTTEIFVDYLIYYENKKYKNE